MMHMTQTQRFTKQLADVMSQREAEMKAKEAAEVRIALKPGPDRGLALLSTVDSVNSLNRHYRFVPKSEHRPCASSR
jgi:hypothetical protein